MDLTQFLRKFPKYEDKEIFTENYEYSHHSFASNIPNETVLLDWCQYKDVAIATTDEYQQYKLANFIRRTDMTESQIIELVENFNGSNSIEETFYMLNEKKKDELPSAKGADKKVKDEDIQDFDGLGDEATDETPPDEPAEEEEPDLPTDPSEKYDTKEVNDYEEGDEEPTEPEPTDAGYDPDATEPDMPTDPSAEYENDDVKDFQDDDGTDGDNNELAPDTGEEDTPNTEEPTDGETQEETEDTGEDTGDEGSTYDDVEDDPDLPPDVDNDYNADSKEPDNKKPNIGKKTDLVEKYESLVDMIDTAITSLTSGNMKKLSTNMTDIGTLKYIKGKLVTIRKDIENLIKEDFLSQTYEQLDTKYTEYKITIGNLFELLLNISKNMAENN